MVGNRDGRDGVAVAAIAESAPAAGGWFHLRGRWLAPLACAAVIFATSCRHIDRDTFVTAVGRILPAGAVRDAWADVWDLGAIFVVKGYHVAEYGLLCWLVVQALAPGSRLSHRRAIVLGALACLLYAASDEWHQTFVPGRGGTPRDVAIDAMGIALAVLLLLRRSRRRAVSGESPTMPARRLRAPTAAGGRLLHR